MSAKRFADAARRRASALRALGVHAGFTRRRIPAPRERTGPVSRAVPREGEAGARAAAAGVAVAAGRGGPAPAAGAGCQGPGEEFG